MCGLKDHIFHTDRKITRWMIPHHAASSRHSTPTVWTHFTGVFTGKMEHRKQEERLRADLVHLTKKEATE